MFLDAKLSVFFFTFLHVDRRTGQSRPALHSCKGPDGLHCEDGREPVLVSFVGGARRSVVDDERGLETERTVPLFSGLLTENTVKTLR